MEATSTSCVCLPWTLAYTRSTSVSPDPPCMFRVLFLRLEHAASASLSPLLCKREKRERQRDGRDRSKAAVLNFECLPDRDVRRRDGTQFFPKLFYLAVISE